jgi:hypothetical protein
MEEVLMEVSVEVMVVMVVGNKLVLVEKDILFYV